MIALPGKKKHFDLSKISGFFKGRVDLGNDRPMNAILRLAVPSMGLFVFNSLLHLVDTIYVSWLGEQQMAAMSFTAPVNLCLFAFLECVGSGSVALMGQNLGRNDLVSARKIAYNGLALLYFICCIMVPLLFPSFSNIIFSAIGVGEDKMLLDLCWKYNMWMPLMLPIMGYTYIGNSIFRVQGDSVSPFKAIALANTINIVLDPILIFTLDWGISGAAIATLLSRIGSSWYLYQKMHKESSIIVDPILKITRGVTHYWKQILWIGVPVALTSASVALGMGSVNKILSTFGHRTVSSWMLGMRVEELAFNFVMGINVAYIPYVAFNYGKRDYSRIKDGFKSAYMIAFVLMCSMSVVLYIYPHIFLGLFRPSHEIEDMASHAIRASIPSYPFTIFTVLATGFFVGTAHSIFGTITQGLRSIVFRVSAAWFFAQYLDKVYIWWFQPMASFGGSLVAMMLFAYLMKKIKTGFENDSLEGRMQGAGT